MEIHILKGLILLKCYLTVGAMGHELLFQIPHGNGYYAGLAGYSHCFDVAGFPLRIVFPGLIQGTVAASIVQYDGDDCILVNVPDGENCLVLRTDILFGANGLPIKPYSHEISK